jgi:hypothetical protein
MGVILNLEHDLGVRGSKIKSIVPTNFIEIPYISPSPLGAGPPWVIVVQQLSARDGAWRIGP